MKKNRFFLCLVILIVLSGSIIGQSYVPVVFIVSDFTTNKTINGAQVSIRQTGWATRSTGTDGKVSFDNVPAGAINFIITKEGYQLHEGEENVSSEVKSNTFRIPLTIIPTDKDKILVTGEVIDKEGRDVEGAWVEVKAANIIQNGLTDKSGNYSIEININSGYQPTNLAIEVKKGDCKIKQNMDIPRGNVVYKDIILDCNIESTSENVINNNTKKPVTVENKEEIKKENTFEIKSELVNGIEVTITNCELVGNKLTCHLLYENKSTEPSKHVKAIGASNKLTDGNGLSYKSILHQVGSVEIRNGTKGYEIIKGTKVKGRVEFIIGDTNFSKIAALNIVGNFNFYDLNLIKK